MLLHTIIDPLAVMEQPPMPLCGYRQSDPFCTCEWTEGEGGQKLRRLISTDLSRYLDPRLQPGRPYSD